LASSGKSIWAPSALLKLSCPVCWVAEDLDPFKILNDRHFQNLIKTGGPAYYISSPSSISRYMLVEAQAEAETRAAGNVGRLRMEDSINFGSQAICLGLGPGRRGLEPRGEIGEDGTAVVTVGEKKRRRM
jgi:hypothetical protein